MNKLTNKLKIAKLVATHARILIHRIHTAGESYCVSGDRRLRELASEFLTESPTLWAYTYDAERPKSYVFSMPFSEWCFKLVEAKLGPQADMPFVRVQMPLGGKREPSKPYDPAGMLCLSCGAVLKKKPYRKDRRFCSSKCRIKWWRKQVYMSDEEFVGQFKSKEAK